MPAEMGASCSFLRSREGLTDGEDEEVRGVRKNAQREVQVGPWRVGSRTR
jgi:hypothetical protein